MGNFLRNFSGSLSVAVVGLAMAFWWGSTHAMGAWTALWLALVLAIFEISLSFDNAVVNAGVLKHMDKFWRTMFLTVGIVVAVFGMRLVFPIVIVALAGDIGIADTIQMALQRPDEYSRVLTNSYPAIAAFGGMFLLLVFLDFIFDDERGLHWLGSFEARLASLGKLDNIAVLTALVVLFGMQWWLPPVLQLTVLVAGLAGVMLYIGVDVISSLFGGPEESNEVGTIVKRTGFGAFMYLEVLDASFSFDGVIGAFAITRDVVVIMIGLAIGAMFVRSMTIYLVNKGTLDEYVFLEHGAHYAIGVLAFIMLAGTQVHVSEVITGLLGVAFIAASLVSSVRYRKQNPSVEKAVE